MAGLVKIMREQIDHAATGKKARADRKRAGLTLKKVSDLMVLSASYISELERGRRNWSDVLMAQYSNALKGIKT